MLITSELLTNAVIHSGGAEVRLTLILRDASLCIAVNDGKAGRVQMRNVDGDAESGRGLALMDTLAKEHGGTWGISENGAETWCSLPLPAEKRAARGSSGSVTLGQD
ncbi:kinase [Streptomyces hygroscopicus subsp. jinggangensis 5008]|nr:kinase [Streptomyces hygroscopicus subsp. jinggangensis 5008]